MTAQQRVIDLAYEWLFSQGVVGAAVVLRIDERIVEFGGRCDIETLIVYREGGWCSPGTITEKVFPGSLINMIQRYPFT